MLAASSRRTGSQAQRNDLMLRAIGAALARRLHRRLREVLPSARSPPSTSSSAAWRCRSRECRRGAPGLQRASESPIGARAASGKRKPPPCGGR